jgi:hypothetical protein
MSRTRVDLGGGSSSRSAATASKGGGSDKANLIKVGVAVAVLLVAGGYVAWSQGLFETRSNGGEMVSAGGDAGQGDAQPQAPAPTDNSEVANNHDGYGDDSKTAAAPPVKRAVRRGGGFINPDAPKDPE